MVNTSVQGVENQAAGLNSQDDVIKSLKIDRVMKSTIIVYLQVESVNAPTGAGVIPFHDMPDTPVLARADRCLKSGDPPTVRQRSLEDLPLSRRLRSALAPAPLGASVTVRHGAVPDRR